MLFTCVSRNKYGKDIFLSPPPNERISKSEMIGIIAHILSLQPIVEKKIYSYIMNNNILRNNGNEDQEITLDRLADEDLLNIDIAHPSGLIYLIYSKYRRKYTYSVDYYLGKCKGYFNNRLLQHRTGQVETTSSSTDWLPVLFILIDENLLWNDDQFLQQN